MSEFKPIQKPFGPKTRAPMYDMHMYWARKPFNVTEEYIRHFTKEGDIVLDPFCGCGVTNVEALELRRKTVAVDLNPLATFIFRSIAMPINLEKFRKAFKQIESSAKNKILSLYKTQCPKCGNESIILYTVWDTELGKDVPRVIRYECNFCKSKGRKTPDRNDLRKIELLKKKKIKFWYPKVEMIWNSRQHIYKGMVVTDLFTKRNLIALTILYHEVDSLPDGPIKDLMKFTFTSQLQLVSRATHEGGGQVLGFFWVPKKGSLERNVWWTFEKRYKKVLKGKKETANLIDGYYKGAENFNELTNHKTCLIVTDTAANLSNIPDDKVDFVMTDPPYADEVPYLEISLFWISWLKLELNPEDFDKEIILSDSPLRPNKKNKTEVGEENYESLLRDAFKEAYRVLKPGKWMSVWFHNRDLKIWNTLINIVTQIGFELVNLVYQPHSTVTFKQIGTLEKAGTLRGHFILNFKKPVEPEERPYRWGVDVEDLIVRTAQKVIVESEGATLSQIYQEVIPVLVKFGVLHEIIKIQEDLAPMLRKYFEEKDGNWYIKEKDYGKLGDYIPLRSRLKLFIPSILKRIGTASIDQIYKELLPLLKNAKTPDEKEIADVLKEVGELTPDGKLWKLRKPVIQIPLAPFILTKLPELKTAEASHEAMIYALAKLGQYAGCSIWIGKKEQSDEFAGEKFSELSLATLPQLGGISEEAMRIIEQIDVLWLKGNMIISAFEVEHTTGVITGLARFHDLLRTIPMIRMDMYIVAPDERKRKVIREFNRPAIREIAKKAKWKYILYSDLLKKYDTIGKERLKIRPEMIYDLAKSPF